MATEPLSMSIQQWNAKLVHAVFHENVSDAPEIRRIDASNNFLAQAGGFSSGDEARASFIKAMPGDPKGVRQLFDHTALAGWSVHAKELPFYAQLHLTILASSADDDLHDEGDFRLRLSQILGLPVGNYISQGCLPELWEKASRWSIYHADHYQNTRRLILPNRDNERIIGYSKRLAFPGFRDQNHLAELFTEKGIDADSPARSLLTAIRQRIGRFSARFHEEFRLFASAWEKGDHEGAINTPFWGAVRETTWRREHHSRGTVRSVWRLEIDPTDPSDPGLWLYGSPHGKAPPHWSKDPSDQLDSGLQRWRHNTDDDAPSFLQKLREQRLSNHSLDVPGPRLGSALADGCIGFIQDEEGRWFNTPAFPQSTTLWILFHRSHEMVLRAIATDKEAATLNKQPLVGSSEWYLVGPIETSDRWREWFQHRVVGLDFFCPPPDRRRVVVVDTVRCHDGVYFWLPPMVPAFRCRGAHGGIAIIQNDSSQLQYDLQLSGDKLLLPENLRKNGKIECTLKVVATDEYSNEITAGKFNFRSTCNSYEFKKLRSPPKFLESGSHGRLEPHSPDWNVVQEAYNKEGGDEGSSVLRRVQRTVPATPEPIWLDPIELDERWRRTTEILSAIFSRRQSLSMGECAQYLQMIWGTHQKGWEKLDDLVENGVLHLLHSRHWSNRLVTVGHPHAVLKKDKESFELRVFGLLSHGMREQADGIIGKSCKVVASPDRKIAGAYVWRFEDINVLEKFQDATNWPIISFVDVPDVCMPSFSDILQGPVREDLFGYDDEEKVMLSLHGKKWPISRHNQRIFPRLERWSRKGQQDLYVLYRKDGSIWNTDCRLWAMLSLWHENDADVGVVFNDGSIRLSDRALKLPRTVSVNNLAVGGGVCIRDTNGSLIYPASDSWSPAMACSRWIDDSSHAYSKEKRQNSALDRYTWLLELQRKKEHVSQRRHWGKLRKWGC